MEKYNGGRKQWERCERKREGKRKRGIKNTWRGATVKGNNRRSEKKEENGDKRIDAMAEGNKVERYNSEREY